MKHFGRILAGVIGLILTLFGGVFFVATAGVLRPSSPTLGSDLFPVGVFSAITLGGLWLVHFAWPGAIARLPGRVFSRDFLLFTPLGHALVAYVAGSVLMFAVGKPALLVALAVLCAYAVGSPALIALRPHWWVNAIVSTLAGIVLVVALVATGEGLTHQHFGDDSLVLLFPVMVFPAALLASLLLRVFTNRNRANARARQGAM